MPNRGEYANAVRKRLEAKRNEADTQKIQRVRESVVPAGATGPDGTIPNQGTGTVGGSGIEVEHGNVNRVAPLGAVGNSSDRDLHEDSETVRAIVESETEAPKVRKLHKLARWIGKEGGESAMADGPAYDWSKSVSKGVKSTSGTALVLMAILGFARGAGIELWNPENDEAAVVILVGATAIVSGVVRGVTNWAKHRKSTG